MGRREQRAEMQSTWMVLEAREPGTPFRRKDMVDADARLDAERAAARNAPHRVTAEDVAGFEVGMSRRVYLPALTGVATITSVDGPSVITVDEGAAQVPMPK